MRYMRNDTSSDDWYERARRKQERREQFLRKIAQEVDRLIRNKQKLSRFREQVAVFVKKANAYLEGEHPPEQAASADSPYLLAPVLAPGWPPIPAPQDQKDLLPDYYFLLALIHDRLLSPRQFVPINNGIYDTEADFSKALWDHYGNLRSGKPAQVLIETALEQIKDDCIHRTQEPARIPREATQNPRPGENRLSGFCSVKQLADYYGIKDETTKETLRKRLERERSRRKGDTNLFVESQNPGLNQPKYLYNSEQVAPIVQKYAPQKPSDKLSDKCPTETK